MPFQRSTSGPLNIGDLVRVITPFETAGFYELESGDVLIYIGTRKRVLQNDLFLHKSNRIIVIYDNRSTGYFVEPI